MAAAKPHMNIVTIGHVDQGKSTLIGRLMWDTGNVPEQTMKKIEEKAKELKKESFKFAYLMDSTKEERERGVTIDIAHQRFDTANRYFTVIDAPGHRDFVKNMITGASQADAAVLVLGAKDGVMPQTKEHVFLIRTLGLKQLLVAVNKMDEVGYEKAAYEKAVEDIKKLLAGVGFKTDTVKYIPVSAWVGDNIAKKSDKMSWYTGETLLEALDKLEVPTKLTGKPLRIPIQDVYTITGIGTVPVGRVETGVIKSGSKVVFMPSGKVGEVKDVEMHHEKVAQAEAGDNIGFNVRGINKGDVNRGEVCGDASNPPTVAEEFTAQIIVLQHPSVITKGYTPVFHAHTSHVACQITEIVKTLDPKTGEVKATNPDFIKAGDAAVIKCKPTKPFVLEKAADYPPLGKFAIRDMGQTIAAGMVLDVVARKTA